MDKDSILQKVEEGIRGYKEQLSKHEGSTLAAMATGAKAGLESAKAGFESAMAGLESLKNSIMENDKAKNAVENMKEHMGKLESAIRDGDKKMSARAVEKMEELLKEYREKSRDDDKTENKDDDPKSV